MITETAESLLSRARIVVRPERFALVGLPGDQLAPALVVLATDPPRFASVVAEPDVTSLVVAEDLWSEMDWEFPGARVERGYRVITFDLEMGWEIVGFLATVASLLAAAGIPLGAICAYTRDHLFVHDDYVEKAVSVLSGRGSPGASPRSSDTTEGA